jgi:hypothetical protein
VAVRGITPLPGSGGGAPVDATYVVVSLDPTLTNERVLTAGTNITIVDGGANGPLTINASGGAGSTGPQGPPGQDGTDGEDGTPGPLGKDGTAGTAGVAGAAGIPLAGEDGMDGDVGPPGPTGATGATGAAGSGTQGPPGPPGEDGQDGEIGPPGPVGAAGSSGSGGIKGSGVATLDFGAFPGASDASVAVTGITTILANSSVVAQISPAATADHTADEHWAESLEVCAGNIVVGTGFTIYGKNTSALFEPLLPISGNKNITLAGGLVNSPSYLNQCAGGIGTLLYGKFNISWMVN